MNLLGSLPSFVSALEEQLNEEPRAARREAHRLRVVEVGTRPEEEPEEGPTLERINNKIITSGYTSSGI